MKKIRIISIYDNNNYGNRLQNLALQDFIKSLDDNNDVKVLRNYSPLNEKKNYLLRYFKYFKNRSLYSEIKGRKEKFKAFNKNIKFSFKTFTSISKPEKNAYYVVGSDQVWNPNMGRLRDVDLLKSVDDSKKISYAASFGVENIREFINDEIRNDLKSFKNLSVREENGKRILYEITNRKDIEVNVDPTMLLSAQEWIRYEKKPAFINDSERYILVYFLGEINDSRKKEIKKVATKLGYKIINILDKNSDAYLTGPSEFLYLEHHASLICTDSFHSCVFGIIFNTPFTVFNREQRGMSNMNSRIETLLRKFDLTERMCNEDRISENLLKACDADKIQDILNREMINSKKYLEKALDL